MLPALLTAHHAPTKDLVQEPFRDTILTKPLDHANVSFMEDAWEMATTIFHSRTVTVPVLVLAKLICLSRILEE